MSRKADKLKSALIESLAGSLRGKPGSDGLAGRFIRHFFAPVPADDLEHFSADDLRAAAPVLWEQARSRRPGAPKVRVFRPCGGADGWHSTHGFIQIMNDDMPFIVDSVTAELNRRDVFIHNIIHPVIWLRRDGRGRVVDFGGGTKAREGFASEAHMFIEISGQPPEVMEDIRRSLEAVLEDVCNAVRDWRAMLARITGIINDLETSPPPLPADEIFESMAFLEWMRDDHFTFLGVRDYDLVREGGKDFLRPDHALDLGVMRRVTEEAKARHAAPLSPARSAFLRRRELLIVTKAFQISTVHRRTQMDYIGVRKFDARGRIVGERRFLGLFTSIAYNQSPRYIPLLRRKLDRVMARAGFSKFSHDGKALLHILETFPRDEMFQIPEDEFLETSLGILGLEKRSRLALFVRPDFLEQFISCLVYVPRERYGAGLVHRIEKILEDSLESRTTATSIQVGDHALARIHYVLKTAAGKTPGYSIADIEAKLLDAARSWEDRLKEALVREKGEEEGLVLWRRFGAAFSAAYCEAFSARQAVLDIGRIEEVLQTGVLGLDFQPPAGASAREIRFKVIRAGDPITPSDALPILENMGLNVVREIPYRARPSTRVSGGTAEEVWIQDFSLETRDGAAVDVSESKRNFEEGFARVWSGDAEDDGFNRLILYAGLTWREAVVLRAYCKFLRQTGIAFSDAYMQDALVNNPALARDLTALFRARFDPGLGGRGARRADQVAARIEAGLEDVASLDEDRIIRRFVNLIQATLRTNYYQKGPAGEAKPYLSFKLNSAAVDDLPSPRPMFEIFVYSPRMEGIHLRGGKVARGGLRWSDRREDFRTEVLGLMKAQMVKNAVIVPVGSKGGFVVKRPPSPDAGREALLDEGIACYRTLIGGMLDLTDNLEGDKVVPPKDVVRHDGDDPYLVVAADKGTAAFSDIANAVSADYGFWLGDAFASGGSAGYDHKKMGITARGAWESVKRHFRELGLDARKRDFTVIGVGDMSGDVFGNGMLLSRHIKLVGAFNHMHIFLDPDPDPAKSHAERRRLFKLARSTWADYNPKLISKGGGVFERKAKAVRLSPEIKSLLGISRDGLTPSDLVQAMLRAEVDLLWFGGIGTFVKAGDETHQDAGDRANDAVRVDGREVRARVIGEGANLGVTQKGRVEYALHGAGGEGGRINTDAIDNSAGVDCSDHEVNIKIALADLIAQGRLSGGRRDSLLARMAGEVAGLVLQDNYRQTLAITLAEARCGELLDGYMRFMRALEQSGRLDRGIEALPDEESLAEREAADGGLTRPEIAVLLAYAKLWLYDELLHSDLPDDRLLAEDFFHYFPEPLRSKYKGALAGHRLRREIIVTGVTNSLVNRAGIAFVHEMSEKTGLSAAEVTRAYAITRDVFGLRDLWAGIDALDNKVPAAVQTEMLVAIGRLIDYSALWFLRHVRRPLRIAETCAGFSPGIAALARGLEGLLAPADREAMANHAESLTARKVPRQLARKIAALDILAGGLDVIHIAHRQRVSVELAGSVYYTASARFQLDWLRSMAAELTPETPWDHEAAAAIIEDLMRFQGEITRGVLQTRKKGKAGEARDAGRWVEAWISERSHVAGRLGHIIGELRAAETVDLAMLAVAARQVGILSES